MSVTSSVQCRPADPSTRAAARPCGPSGFCRRHRRRERNSRAFEAAKVAFGSQRGVDITELPPVPRRSLQDHHSPGVRCFFHVVASQRPPSSVGADAQQLVPQPLAGLGTMAAKGLSIRALLAPWPGPRCPRVAAYLRRAHGDGRSNPGHDANQGAASAPANPRSPLHPHDEVDVLSTVEGRARI